MELQKAENPVLNFFFNSKTKQEKAISLDYSLEIFKR